MNQMRKKSAQTAVTRFKGRTKTVHDVLTDALIAPLSDAQRTAIHDWAVIKLHIAFENLVLDALVAAINQDTATVAKKLDISLPKHLQDDVCEFLVTQGRYFDAESRSTLIDKVRYFLPPKHPFVTVLVSKNHKTALDQVTSLRNLAAHESRQSRSYASTTVGKSITSAGAWLKQNASQHAFDLITKLDNLADDIEKAFPF
jgi:hypothetical protein